MSDIRVELHLKDGSFQSGMLRAGKSVSKLRSEVNETGKGMKGMERNSARAATSMLKTERASGRLLSTLRDVSIVSGAITLAFQGIIGASGGIISSITKTNMEIERLKYQMLGMSTSAKGFEEAAASVEYLRQKALQMPFSLNELANSFVKIKATGVDPMKGSLQSLADGIAAFGGSDEQLHRVTLGIVQMSGKSVIQMEEMRQQLGESMPNAMRVMARSMGVSVAELTQAISTGRVEAGSALQAFYGELERAYGGEAQRMMGSFAGQVSQLKANLQLLATGDGMKGFFEEQKSALMDLNEFLQTADAKRFTKAIGDALAATVRGLHWAVGAAYEFRQELMLLAQVVSAGLGLKMLRGLLGALLPSFAAARAGAKALWTELAAGTSMMALGANGLRTMQSTATSAAMALSGAKVAVTALGRALIISAPWLAALGVAVSSLSGGFGKLSDNTKEAYDSLLEYGAESKKQAKQTIEEYKKDLEGEYKDLEFKYRLGSIDTDEFNKEAARISKAYKGVIDETDRLINEGEEADNSRSVRRYKREMNEILLVHRTAYRERMVTLDKERDAALMAIADEKDASKKAYEIREQYKKDVLEAELELRQKLVGETDKELERLKEQRDLSTSKNFKKQVNEVIDFLNGKRIEFAKEVRSMEDLSIKLTVDVESNEQKVERGSKKLLDLVASVKGLEAEMAGAGNAFAKMQFQIARGDFGSIEEGGELVAELHQRLLDATAQKEMLDKLMEGNKKAQSDLDSIALKNMERRLDLQERQQGIDIGEAERFLRRLEGGYYEGLGPEENIRKAVSEVVGAFNTNGAAANDLGEVIRENTFGPRTVERIGETASALERIGTIVSGISSGLRGIDFAGAFSGAMTGKFGASSGGNAMLDLIASVESGAAGYNATLDNGRWTNGPKNLTSMTLREVRQLQKYMLSHPENRTKYGNGKGSSALGRYQIVGKTLQGLMDELGLSPDLLYDEKMQDFLGTKLLERRGGSVDGLRQEWAGLKNVSDEKILAALGHTQMGPTRARAAALNLGAGAPPALPTYQERLVADGLNRTEDLTERARALAAEEAELDQAEEARKLADVLEGILSKQFNKKFQRDGMGSNEGNLIEDILNGEITRNKNPNDPIYKEAIEAARELDRIEEELAKKKKARNQSEEQHKELEKERAEIARRIAEEQARAKDPDYEGQSKDLTKLIADLDKYVERVRVAYGADSDEAKAAQAYRSSLIGSQKRLDAATASADMEAEIREMREGLMAQDELRAHKYRQDLERVDKWLARQREMGAEEVEIVRQAEEMKRQIREQYQRDTNPVVDQMTEWRDLGGKLIQSTTGWLDNMASGVTGLITGTGDLRSAISGIVNDLINAQVKFLYSSMVGDKTSGAVGKLGSTKGGIFAQAHTGGIAGGSLRTTRANPAVFANAPRFHTGGIAGVPRLKKDEIPIVAKKKEGIFTEEQMAALAPVGSGNNQVAISAPITVNGSAGTPEQNEDLAKRMSREMESTMRGVVVSELQRQMRPGNMMNNRRTR